MIEIDLGEVDARHDEAVLVGRKFDTGPLSEEDILTLFRCVSDIPEVLAYASNLERRLREAGTVIVRAQDALTPDHKVWWVLDDYDGSMDSVKALARLADAAMAVRPILEMAKSEVLVRGELDGVWDRLMEAIDTWAWKGPAAEITDGVPT